MGTIHNVGGVEKLSVVGSLVLSYGCIFTEGRTKLLCRAERIAVIEVLLFLSHDAAMTIIEGVMGLMPEYL
jgi:hypothetical protein